MADRFPLVVDSTNNNLKELPSGDNLDLTGSGIKVGGTLTLGGVAVTATGTELNLLASAGTLKQAGKETIWVPATAMYPNTTAGCSALTQVELSNGPELKCLDFDDGSDEYAQFTVAFPKSWNLGTVTFQAFWTSSATDTGTCSWALQGVGMNSGATTDVSFGTAIAVADAAESAANKLYVTGESNAVTIDGTPADDDLTFFQVSRDTSADNMEEDARLLGIKLFFTTDAANDA